MAFWNKNKEKKEEEAQKSEAAKPDYKVTIWEDVGYSVREVKTFYAYRFVDEDKTPFIQNEDLKFIELYPQDLKDIVPLNAAEIEKKLKEIEAKLKEIRNKKIEDYKEDEPNTQDLEFEILKLKAKQRGLKYDKSGSYVSFDSKGQVCFNFKRQGNTFFPFKWDTNTDTVFVPSDGVTKKAGILLRNKENKYMPKKLVETTTLILLVVGVILVVGNIILGAWMWSKYDSSNIGALEMENLKIQQVCSEVVLTNAKFFVETVTQVEKYINQTPTTNIQGLVPNN
jgi:hypothetical protein